MRTSTARHRERPRRAHAVGAALAAASVLGALVTGLAVPAAQAAGGTVLLEDNFMNAAVSGTSYVAGGINTTACLTASTNTAQTPIPGCGTPADPDGSGALRLTPAENDAAGFLVYDRALPTKAGLDITFNQYQWGSTNGAADGLSFFLADGNQTLTTAGGFGGSLGYNNQAATTLHDGVPNALVGIGFDVYGNFTNESHNPDCADNALRGFEGGQKSTVAVRGPGNGASGYCLLSAAEPAPQLDQSAAATRPAAVVTRVVVDPPTTTDPKVTVFLDDVVVVQVDQPAALRTTPTFKFGWGASTGGQNNNHEINFLKVESVDPIVPDLGVTGSTPAVGVAGTGARQMSWTVDADAASGPLPAGEPVRLTVAAPSGAGIGSPSGAGGSCAGSTASLIDCTHVPAATVAPGGTLPPLSAWGYPTNTGSGAFGFTATVSSPTNDAALASDDSVTTTAVWRPRIVDADASGMYASHQPGSLQIAPYAFGSNLSYEIVTPADPAVGTVSINGPYVRFSPAPGRSGPLDATIRAFDGNSWSDPAPARMPVLPVAAADAVTAPQGATTTRQLPAGIGTSLTYELLTDDVPGTLSLSPSGELQVAPGTGDSGVFTASYRVVDAYGTASNAVTVTVTVPPTAGTTSWTSSLDADGEAGTVLTLPTPSGTGPFTYQLVGGLPAGTTGSLTGDQLAVDAVTGTSGAHTVTYTVTDGDSVVSAPQTVDVTFRPYAALADATGTAADPVTTDVPTAVGTGPFTTVVEGASGGTASVTPDGRVVLDTDGASGRFTVDVHVEDANGVASSTQVVQVEVSPVAHDVAGEAVAAATPSPVVLTPATPTGTGPFTLTVVSGPATASGATLAVTPAPGASGVVEVGYTVTDGQGLVSEPATATLTVRPAAAGSAEQLKSGTSETFALPTPVGTGPFTHQLVSAASGPWGSVAVVDGELQVTAAATFSGPVVVRYTVTDAATLVSDEVEVALDVVPATPGGSVPTQAQATGTAGSPVTGPTPAPTGTGPFAFELVGTVPPEQGTATIDPATGVITFVPAPGWSGEATVAYRVVDGNGDPSAPSAVVFAVAPVATTTPVPPTRTTAGSPATVQAPAPVGTGPFTFELVGTLPPSVGTVTIDPVTGVVTFVPAPGWSGEAPVQYRVLDGNGDPSAPSQVLFVVAPVAPAAAAPATTPAGTPLTVTLPTPVGTGPFTFTLVDGPTPEQGTLTLDPVTGEVTFVPAAGYAGTFEITYTVTDANGVVSDPQVLGVTVAAPPAPAVRVPATVTQAARAVVSALPRTGGELALVGGLAGGLVLVGGALVLLTRRRTTG